MSLRTAHTILGWTVVFGNGFVGLWALAAHWVNGLRHPLLWWVTAVIQTLVAVQVVLGVIFMQSSGIQAQGIHQFYGYVAMLSVALIYSYRLQIEKWRYLLYGFGGLFIMGLALRAVFIPT
jgi:hypothetical protein